MTEREYIYGGYFADITNAIRYNVKFMAEINLLNILHYRSIIIIEDGNLTKVIDYVNENEFEVIEVK